MESYSPTQPFHSKWWVGRAALYQVWRPRREDAVPKALYRWRWGKLTRPLLRVSTRLSGGPGSFLGTTPMEGNATQPIMQTKVILWQAHGRAHTPPIESSLRWSPVGCKKAISFLKLSLANNTT